MLRLQESFPEARRTLLQDTLAEAPELLDERDDVLPLRGVALDLLLRMPRRAARQRSNSGPATLDKKAEDEVRRTAT